MKKIPIILCVLSFTICAIGYDLKTQMAYERSNEISKFPPETKFGYESHFWLATNSLGQKYWFGYPLTKKIEVQMIGYGGVDMQGELTPGEYHLVIPYNWKHDVAVSQFFTNAICVDGINFYIKRTSTTNITEVRTLVTNVTQVITLERKDRN